MDFASLRNKFGFVKLLAHRDGMGREWRGESLERAVFCF
jgi:hypothetical protein